VKKIYKFVFLAISITLALIITQYQAEAKSSDFTIVDGVLTQYNGKDTNITIPNGVTKIGDKAFYRSKSTTKVILPSGVTEIGKSAFENSSLTEIILPDGLKTIGESAFQYTNLTDIIIPDSVTTIGNYAFAECNEMEEFFFSSSVSSIGVGVFNKNHVLTGIHVSTANPNFSADGIMLYNKDKTTLISYPSANGVITLPEGIVETGEKVFADYFYGFSKASVTKIIFPSTFKRLGNYTFADCQDLEEITLPSSLESFGKQSFKSSTKLSKLNLFDSGNSINFVFENGALYNKDKTVLYLTFEKNNIVIPDNITGIGAGALTYVTGTVMVPTSVTSFGENIFDKDDEDNAWADNRVIVYGYQNSPIEDYCKANPYAITFLALDGTYTIQYSSGMDSDDVNFPDNLTSYTRDTKTFLLKKPTLPGYLFQYWYTTNAKDIYGSYTKRYDNDYMISKVSEIPKGSMGDMTLIAKWTKVSTGQAKINSATKASATKITLKLNPVSGVQGYQIVYANNTGFTSGKKTVTTKALTYSLTNLKKGKTYYVKVRAYKLDSCGNRVYGKYSTLRKVIL
jgi:hypothetical protein